MITKRLFVLLIICSSIIGLGVANVAAQDEEPAACAQIVQDALTQLGNVCAANSAGQSCIGFPEVTATFSEEVDDNFFTQPGDIADLTLLDTVTTSPLNIDDETGGLSIINTSANLPTEVVDSLNGKGVLYLVFGGLEVSEATPADNIVLPLRAGVPVSTLATADLREAPLEVDGDFNNVVGRIPAEASVSADAVTQDGDWVRVTSEGISGWLRSSVLPASADLSSLVEIGPDNFAPMQAINLALNGSDAPCMDAYQSLIVQGPQTTPVDIVIDGIPVQLRSTLQITLDGNVIRFQALTSVIILFPNDPDRRTIIPSGFYAEYNLGTGEFVTPAAYDGTNITPLLDQIPDRFPEFPDSRASRQC